MADSTDGLDDLVKEAKEAFDLCVEHEAQNRADALDDIKFARLEEQWPAEVRKRRELDGRPCLTFSKLGAFRRQVVNDARQNRPAIKVHPADDAADPKVAEILNGLIRNIEYVSDADVAYDTAMEAAVDGGFGYFGVNIAYANDDSFDLDLRIEPKLNPFAIWGDPFSVAHDSADWNVSFEAEMMKRSVFVDKFPGADTANWDTSGYGALNSPWLDGEEVMVAKYWRRDEVLRTILALSNGEVVGEDVFVKNQDLYAQAGVTVLANRDVPSHKVTLRLMSGCEVLEEQPWPGRYIPIIPVYGDVVYLEGRRHLRSLIRSAKDAQIDYNFQRTTYTEKTALAPKVPFIGPKGAFKTDADKWATANIENHPYIEFDGTVAPQRQDMSTVAQGELQGMMQASNDMKSILGLFDASLGAQDPKEQSGRAILALQKRGDVATFHIVDNLSRAIRHAGRILIDLIPETYTGPRIARLMGPDGVPSLVPVNQPAMQVPPPPGTPVGAQPRWVPAPQPQPGLPPPAAAPMTGPEGAPPTSPDGGDQAIMATFDLSVGKYDVVVEAGPSFATKREEAASQMLLLVQAYPEIIGQAGDILAKNLDWAGADELVARFNELKQAQQQQGGGADAKVQAEMQATLAKIKAEGDARQQQMAQEAQLKSEQAQRDHELAMTQAQNDAALEKYKADQQIATQRTLNEQTIQLKREQAAAELQLARESAEQSFKIEMAEALAKADRTVDAPITTIGGGIG